MLNVRVLGGVTAECDGQPVPTPGSGRAIALLGWLALHPGMHSRATVAARLWPDVVDASARQSMRSALWSLRQSLDRIDAAALVTTRDRLGLRADTWIDIVEFDAHVAAGRLAAAVGLSDGDLLAGVDDDWAIVARDEHRARIGAGLVDLAEQANDPRTAVRWARRAVTLDPLSEEAARVLVAALADADDRPAALAVYQKLADRLRRELRVAPSEPTWRLAEQIRTRTPTAPSVRARPGLLRLVGRDRELTELHAAWALAQSGHGGLCVVHGNPGIGKTRLVTQLADLAARDGAAVATGAAPDLAGPLLTPWIQVCGELVHRFGELPDAPWVAALAPMLPAQLDATGDDATSPNAARARLSEAVVALLEELSRRTPVLVVVEDLHAADDASLALLGHVARRISETAVLVVATRRDRPVRDHLATLELAARQAGVARADIALGPLDAGAISTLAREAGAATEAAAAQVVAAADGNALLAVEAARALAAGEPLPVGLRGAVQAALARLDPPARELVRTLAVAGREVGLAEAGERARVDLIETLPAAEEQGLLECTGQRVRFRHALLRDAVYADLPPAERMARHARAAEQLTGSHERAAEAAAHLRATGRVREAGELLVAAARQARTLGALADATDLLREAVNALPDDPAPALALADVLAWRGRPGEARAVFDSALPLLERSGDPAAVATAHLRYAEWHFRPACVPRVAIDACRRALAVMDGAGVDDPDLRAQILAVYAWCESLGGDPDDAERALAWLAESAGDEPDDAYVDSMANSARCTHLLRQGQFEEAAASGIRAGDRALSAGRADLAYTGLINAAFAQSACGDLEAALGLLDRLIGALRGHGMLAAEARVQIARAWVLVRLGRVTEAAEAAGEGRRTADRLDAPELQALVDAERGRVALRAGDYRAAIALLSAALAESDAAVGRPLARLQRAEALVRLGAVDEAEAALVEVALEPVRPGDWPDTLVARMSAVEGLIAAARGDRTLARRRLTAAADGWRRRRSPAEIGQQITDLMLDLGRPIIGLVVPAEELAAVEADLASLTELTEV